jgi:hypothetical protein
MHLCAVDASSVIVASRSIGMRQFIASRGRAADFLGRRPVPRHCRDGVEELVDAGGSCRSRPRPVNGQWAWWLVFRM